MSSTGFAFLDKHKKISFVILSNVRVSRFGYNFKGYDFKTSRGEKENTSGTMSTSIEKTVSDSQRADSGYRPFDISSHCSTASSLQ